jgi:quercetin dioxygenase-like cupin family protein
MNFIRHGVIDVDSIESKLGPLDWNEYTFRQTRFNVHRETLTVPLLWNEVPGVSDVPHTWYPVFKDDLSVIERQLKCHIHTALLIKLPAGKVIPTHVDAAPHFRLYSRIHIPIVTNPECLFTVGGETKHLERGHAWEIDNDGKKHSVVNHGEEDRVHLLLDVLWVKENPL